MKTIWTIMKKELSRVFKDKKLIFTILIMPGLLIFAVYSLMGDAISKQIEETMNQMDYKLYVKNASVEYINLLETLDVFEIVEFEEEDIDYKVKVVEEKRVAYLIFSDDFENTLLDGANVEFYYNSL